MKSVYMSSESLEALVEERRRTGIGRLDECWEGVWHLTDPTGKHQRITFAICRILAEVVEDAGLGTAWISINITDRERGWKKNHRCPDGAIILDGNRGRWIEDEKAFLGGPDLILEVLSHDDDTYEKLPFYAARGIREVLMVDPETYRTELFTLREGEYEKVPAPAESQITGLVFSARPQWLEVRHPDSGRDWKVR